MAINKIEGIMLQDDLLRYGQNLSIEGNLLYLDVTNNRIGINNAFPTTDLDISGSINVSTQADIADLTIVSNNIQANTGDLNLSSAGDTLISPASSKVVNIISTTSLGLPAGTTAQRPSSPNEGYVRFNNILGILEIFDGVTWGGVGPGFLEIASQIIIPNGAATAYSLDQSTTTNGILVSINGTMQEPATSYTVAGSVITFADVLLTTDNVLIRFITSGVEVQGITDALGTTSMTTIAGVATITVAGTDILVTDGTNLTFNADFIPNLDNTYDIGTTSKKVKNIQAVTLNGTLISSIISGGVGNNWLVANGGVDFTNAPIASGGDDSIALGEGATVTNKNNAIAIGTLAEVTQSNGISIGNTAKSGSGIAIGTNVQNNGFNDSITIGKGLSATASNEVQIGVGLTGYLTLVTGGALSLNGGSAQFIMPNYPTTGLPSGTKGGMTYDTTKNNPVVHNGASWDDVLVQKGVTPLSNYLVAGVPTAVGNTGSMIFVTDEVGGSIPAFSDGTNWRRVTDRAIVS